MSFQSGFKRADTGIHTIEGNLAGSRAARLTKKRDKEQAEYERKKQNIIETQHKRFSTISEKFAATNKDAQEAEFKSRTVGLVTAEEFRMAREQTSIGGLPTKNQNSSESFDLLNQDKLSDNAESKNVDEEKEQQEEIQKNEEDKKKKNKKKRKMPVLSFSFDDENQSSFGNLDNGEIKDEMGDNNSPNSSQLETSKKPRLSLKDPNVDTSFLPDREREKLEEEQRSRLRKEWFEQQEKIKNEKLEVTYSFWDGTGHRRVIVITKGMEIGKFLELARQQVAKDFPDLRNTTVDNLIYVKEDLIIPHHYSFYDLIVTKARGKSGPLFHFDVHDDVRIVNDTRIEKDESHPGKVVEKKWYERNKHIFPASRWEFYDPRVERATYTIHGHEIN